MPSRADLAASHPKCPSFCAEGPTTRRCDRLLVWSEKRGVWVCPNHPHMEVKPHDFDRAALASREHRPW